MMSDDKSKVIQNLLDALERNGYEIVPALDAELWRKLVASDPHCEDGWGNLDRDLEIGIRLSDWIAKKRVMDAENGLN